MYKLTAFLCAILALGITVLAFPEGLISVFIAAMMSLGVCFLIRRQFKSDSKFLIHLFLLAAAARMALSTLIYVYDLYDFFGPDALFYDLGGRTLSNIWWGVPQQVDPQVSGALRGNAIGWIMHYFSGSVYFVAGQSMLHVQTVCCIIGAATVPAIYYCSQAVYANQRVARYAAVGVAFFPSFIIWSSQMLKDGIIVFLIVLAMCSVYSLQKKLNYAAGLALVLSLLGIISLRFYIFYMVAAAVAGSFAVGTGKSNVSLLRRLAVFLVLAVAIAYTGVWKNASLELAQYGSFERLRLSRQYASQAASSGYDANLKADVSTPLAALTVVPIGMVYLFLAPFPWEVKNFRQAITLPETFLWWSLIPIGFWGLWYTLKNRLRAAIPVLVFTMLLTLSYSVYQGNVGTAYRQRTQIQVFLFVFIAVGAALLAERREDRKLLDRRRASAFAARSLPVRRA